MTLPSYQITFTSCRTGLTQYVLDPSNVDDLIYSRVLNGVGSIAFSMDAYNPYAIELQDRTLDNTLDDFIEVYRTNPIDGKLQLEETYLLRLMHVFIDENNLKRLAIGGYSLNHLFTRRIIDPDDDPFQAGGYSTKAGRCSDVMREYAIQQIGAGASAARQIPLLDIPSLGSFGLNVGNRLRHDPLIEVLQGFADRGECDFQIKRISGNSLRAEFKPIGVDRRETTNYPLNPYLILDPNRGNLNAPSLMYDRKEEANFIYALGQGQGARRKLLKLAGQGLGDSPYNRSEFTDDVRNAQRADALTMLTEATATLKERRPRAEFTFTPTGIEAGNVYRDDWDLGDYVTAKWDSLSLDLRFYSVEIALSSNDEQITPTIKTL